MPGAASAAPGIQTDRMLPQTANSRGTSDGQTSHAVFDLADQIQGSLSDISALETELV